MSACHLKNENWKRAVEAADKVRVIQGQYSMSVWLSALCLQALAKNENNGKAMFRKGKALGEQGFFERAVKVLEDLKKKCPSGTYAVVTVLLQFMTKLRTEAASADAEIARLKVIDDEKERQHRKKMKGTCFLKILACGPMLTVPKGFLSKDKVKAGIFQGEERIESIVSPGAAAAAASSSS